LNSKNLSGHISGYEESLHDDCSDVDIDDDVASVGGNSEPSSSSSSAARFVPAEEG
jgi:hypothetical protein